MRLIDADALMEKEYSRLREGEVLHRIPPSHVDAAPTIDAVPVVRCWECIYYKICDEWENGKRILCEIHHHSYLDHDGDNHFCSWGQRKIETVLPKSDAKDESLEADHEVS